MSFQKKKKEKEKRKRKRCLSRRPRPAQAFREYMSEFDPRDRED